MSPVDRQQGSAPEREVRMKEIFSELVANQDRGNTVEESRVAVAEQFGVSLDAIKDIERLGIAEVWPPL